MDELPAALRSLAVEDLTPENLRAAGNNMFAGGDVQSASELYSAALARAGAESAAEQPVAVQQLVRHPPSPLSACALAAGPALTADVP